MYKNVVIAQICDLKLHLGCLYVNRIDYMHDVKLLSVFEWVRRHERLIQYSVHGSFTFFHPQYHTRLELGVRMERIRYKLFGEK